jgi:DNA-binding transcriptional regulator YhcF (GntR family)
MISGNNARCIGNERSYQRACRFIQLLLDSGTYCDGEHLPRLSELARSAKVAPSVMSAVLAGYAAERKIAVSKKAGIVAGDGTMPGPALPPRWMRVRDAIERSIIEGEFPDRRLPELRSFQKKYHAGFQVVRRALDSLESDHLLIESNNGRFIAGPAERRSSGELVFLGLGYEDGKIKYLNERLIEFSMVLHRQCTQAGLSFVPRGIPEGNPDAAILTIKSQSNAIGFVVWANGITPPAFSAVTQHLAQQKNPVVIIDEIGNLQLPFPLRDNRHIRLFTIAGQRAGKQIGRMLIGLGHHHAAYLSAYGGSYWSDQRYQGLHDAFTGPGFNGSIQRISAVQISHPDAPTVRQVQARLARFFISWEKAPVRATRNYAPLRSNIETAALSLIEFDSLRAGLQIVLRRLAADAGITAWICEKDYVAAVALDYLGSGRRHVPR